LDRRLSRKPVDYVPDQSVCKAGSLHMRAKYFETESEPALMKRTHTHTEIYGPYPL
jgi:hypothetical protein